MSFTLTPVAAPTVEREPDEYDALVPQVQALAANDQWASLPFDTQEEADLFKRKFGEACRRIDISRRFAKDTVASDGKVTVTFTTRAKIVRQTKEEKAAADAAAAEASK